jgi:hypothetical protein
MKILILAILTLSFGIVQGQVLTQDPAPSLQLLGSAGDTYKNSSYQLDWSVGELLTETFAVSQNQLTQGFHQGNYTITAIDQAKDLQFEITAFPNPTTDIVVLGIESQNIEAFRYILTDVNGKILQDRKIESNQQQINLSEMAAGAYFLSVRTNKKAVKTFKIIKSN